MVQINIEKIMEEIRQEIKDKGYDDSMLSFDDVMVSESFLLPEKYDKGSMIEAVQYLNSGWNIVSYKYVGSGIKGFLKKVFRKLIKFYVEPIVEEQNQYNAFATRAINLVNCYMEEKNKECNELRSEIEKLKIEISKKE